MSARGHRRLSTALLVTASVLLLAATLVTYARRTVFDSGHFADRASVALHDPRVRTLAAEHVTDRLVLRAEPDLLAGRPIIVGAVSGVIGGRAFGSLFHRSVLDAHRALFARDQNTITLTLADVATVVSAAVRKLRPKLADQLDRERPVVLVRDRVPGLAGDLARTARDARLLAWLLIALAAAAAAGAVMLAPDRRRATANLGAGVAVVGMAIVIAYAVARAVVLAGLPAGADHGAASAVWDAFLSDLRRLGWVLIAVGAVVFAAARSLLRPVSLERPARVAWRAIVDESPSAALRVLRAALLVAAGVVMIAAPALAVQLAVVLLGVVVLAVGVEALLRTVWRPPAPDEKPAAIAPRRSHRGRRLAGAGVAALLVAGVVAAFLAGGGVEAPAAAPITRCNGHAELCDRRLDDVVLPATHNAMSVPLPGWASAEQDRPIGGQLADGIRGLLLDTHYGDKLANGRVRTDFGDASKAAVVARQDGVSPAAVAAALRLRERLGFRGKGKRGIYLCHTFCEIGATPLADGLRDVHDFLVTHPAEVVVIVNQDYVTPADFVGAVRDAGLTRYAFDGLDAARWPTLREMIASDHRLVLLAENHAGAAPWYQLAYKRLTEETPYTFHGSRPLLDPALLPASCRPNRGPARAPLFLINHWVSTDPAPRPSDAAKVNAYGPLLARARECQRIRGHLPNLLAVNFYKRGDVFRVVDTLNGIRAGSG